jgi:hypothetical protein
MIRLGVRNDDGVRCRQTRKPSIWVLANFSGNANQSRVGPLLPARDKCFGLGTSASIGLRFHLVQDLLNVEGCRFLALWEFFEGHEELSHDIGIE